MGPDLNIQKVSEALINVEQNIGVIGVNRARRSKGKENKTKTHTINNIMAK